MMIEGSRVIAKTSYVGGREGFSRFEYVIFLRLVKSLIHLIRWFRVSENGEVTQIEHESIAEYTLTANDVGCFMRVAYTPVRADGVEGETVTITASEPVGAGMFYIFLLYIFLIFLVLPRVSDMFLTGTLVEGETLHVRFRVTGGHPDKNELTWFRGSAKEEGVVIWDQISNLSLLNKTKPSLISSHIPGATTPDYTLTLEDVGKLLKFQFLPVNERGIPGGVGEQVTKLVEPGIFSF